MCSVSENTHTNRKKATDFDFSFTFSAKSIMGLLLYYTIIALLYIIQQSNHITWQHVNTAIVQGAYGRQWQTPNL